MFKNVLVISDNANLCHKFAEVISNKPLQDFNFSFSISPYSNKKDFQTVNNSEIKLFDLKNSKDVDHIKSTYDLVFSIHCKQIFPTDLVRNVKCINIHPGYNPINRGWYPQVFSIVHGLPIGATIHEIDEKLDHGAIIARKFVDKNSYDTSETLYNKILVAEIELLNEYIEAILNNSYTTFSPENQGNIFLKKDFNALLALDLQEQTTVGDFIDKLRALTHGDFDNAYFIDPDSGKKVHVGIRLKSEDDEKS